jgi:Zn-finger nucleic acid-binding protein/ribosomal protein L40E
VTVRQPAGHEAAVVRCSSCGAPRESGESNCRFCGADFTLHERDLDTVCPKCFARVSDRAKFCHHCGSTLAPESVAGDKTELTCPCCEPSRKLSVRKIGGVPLFECEQCAGLWLTEHTFDELTRKANDRSTGLDPFFNTMGTDTKPEPAEPVGKWRYRKCPQCGQLMVRRQYSSGSGVIIDSCRDHGVWFDPDELPRILAFIRGGKHAQAVQRERAEAIRNKRYRRITRSRTMTTGGGTFGDFSDDAEFDTSLGGGLLGILVAAAFDIFNADP